MAILQVERLCKDYKTYHRGGTFLETTKSIFHRNIQLIHALTDVNFSVETGELLGLIGPNGAGKSTLLKILTGIMTPTSGRAEVLGFSPARQRRQYVRHIGAVFGQKSQLMWDIPPYDAFLMNKAIFDLPKKDFNDRIEYMTKLLDIETVIRKPTRQLSLGERMKCEFVMAVLHRPRLVFLDEPTIGLDVVAKEQIRLFIQKMNAEDITFILTTHDVGDIERLARRVVLINHGKLVFDDKIEQLQQMAANKKVEEITVTVTKPIENILRDLYTAD